MHVTPQAIATAIVDAPAWAQIGLTAPSPRLREDAANEVAQHLYTALYAGQQAAKDQLPLDL